MADYIRCKNLGSKPLRLGYNNRVTVIQPGEDGIIDRECACIHFGNWERRNYQRLSDGRWMYERREELRRLKGQAGSDDEGRSALEHDDVWQARKPKVEIWDGNVKVVSVIDDPEGSSMPEPVQSNMGEQIAWLQKQIQELQGKLLDSQTEDEMPDIPEDSPDTASRRNPRAAQIAPAERKAVR